MKFKKGEKCLMCDEEVKIIARGNSAFTSNLYLVELNNGTKIYTQGSNLKRIVKNCSTDLEAVAKDLDMFLYGK